MAISLNLTSEGKDRITRSMVQLFETAMLCSLNYGYTLDASLGDEDDLAAKSADHNGTRITLEWATSNGSRTTNKPENSNGLIFPISAGRTIRYLVLLQKFVGESYEVNYMVRGHFDLGTQTPTKVSAYVLDNISIGF